ncbi:MAG TPA: flagellar hook protein FlgE [Vicinamibacterales bacterium]|jgi:flagellar hook protein FlgE
MAVGSFSSALSGLNANSAALGVIGNNLANINTIGFKASTVTFQDLVSQTVGGTSANPMQVGLGVVTGSISPTFSQGSIANSTEATNVAIQGNGFFLVSGGAGQAYTRAGNFAFDRDGFLVTPDGYKVQGYTTTDPITGQVTTNGTPTNLVVPPGVLRAPTATTTFRTLVNLDAGAAVGSTFVSSVQIYDVKGAPHVMTATYTKSGAGTWTYALTVPGADVTGVAGAPPSAIPAGSGGTGTLVFDANGKLQAAADITVTTPAWANGAAATVMTWDVLDTATGAASFTGYSSPSATSSITQNGSAPGAVDNISIGSDGTISATFGAGQTVAIGKLALATFNNPKGLVKLGSNRYGETQAAGQANVGAAGTGGRGTLIGSALEQSNVDIAAEFTAMILAQRGYQANSKSITTSDELLQETLNLKR